MQTPHQSDAEPVPRLARRALGTGSALLGALLGWHAPDEGDLFWHLALGRAVLRAGARTVPEPYALVSLGEPRAVPEWLWGVITYHVEQLGGFAALTGLTMLLGALSALLGACWIDRLCREQPLRAPAGVLIRLLLTVVMLALMAGRLRLRPELPASCLTLGFLLLARDFAGLPPRRRLQSGAWLLAISLLWAQLHGSFVLAPALFVCCAGRPGADPLVRRDWLALLFALLLSLLSSAHGIHFVQYILDHAGGDGAHHMLDMLPPSWGTLTFARASGTALSLCALSWLVALLLARVRLRDLGLALLGLALFLTAVRFAVLLCLFALPLSVAGLAAISRVRDSWWSEARWARALLQLLVAALACALTTWLVVSTDRARPLGASGVPADTFPLRAAAVLRQLPAGSAVYTPSMQAGSLLGYLGDGRLRVSLDSRIPLHFDDAEYGTHRDSEQTPEALDRFFRRFGFQAAVAPRDSNVCRLLANRMRLASVDPTHATFVTGEGSALPGLDPCSPDHLALPCAEPTRLADSLRRVRAQRDDAYASWLATIAEVGCGRSDVRAVLARPSPARALNGIRAAVERWRVRALWRSGEHEQALAELTRALRGNDAVLSVLSELWSDQPPPELASFYRRVVLEGDDFTPPEARRRLAMLCLAAGDLECAYVQGLRGALLGDPLAPRVLQLVAERHPSDHVRRSLNAWLRVFASEMR